MTMLQTPPATASPVEELVELIGGCRQFPARIAFDMPAHDGLAWLDAQPFGYKVAWSERGEREILAGAGDAAVVHAIPGAAAGDAIVECRALLQEHPDLRWFGGFSFDATAAWPSMGAGQFVLPRFLLHRDTLYVTVLNAQDVQRAIKDAKSLLWDVPPLTNSLPTPVEIDYLPNHQGWNENVRQALDLIDREVLEKIVLARQTRLRFDEDINPICLTKRLALATHDCYIFCLQFAGGPAFLGATPERLFRREGDRLLSEVVAGTRPRGKTSGEDQRLAYELLTSDKDQLEHEIVRKSIRQRLHRLVDSLEVATHASVLRLAHKQHLCSEVEAVLKPGVDEGALLGRLHPTPAVGGYPTENALPEIDRLEPFARGWYAAPIGWVGAYESEFVVGIRSGLVEHRQLSLYSGAGIVKGSEPEQEWAEIENKIDDFTMILGSKLPSNTRRS